MGAEQVGYLLKCPAKLTDRHKTTAAHRLNALASLQQAGTGRCADCNGLVDPETSTCTQCGMWAPDLSALTTTEKSRALVNKLTADWPFTAYRDVASRYDDVDPKLLILFAGTETWGDTPDGAGYTAFRALFAHGIADSLGIR